MPLQAASGLAEWSEAASLQSAPGCQACGVFKLPQCLNEIRTTRAIEILILHRALRKRRLGDRNVDVVAGNEGRETGMAYVTASDAVRLFFEETGSGEAILFIHEFSGDSRSWDPQVRYFCRRYRCITFNARGYPPSDVPQEVGSYSQRRAVDDARDVLDHLGIRKAHVVGLSMGGFAAMHFAICYPDRALSVTIGGVGFGAEPNKTEKFREELEVAAQRWERDGAAKFAPVWGLTPGRVQLRDKDPRAFAVFMEQLAEHSAKGAANTLRGVQKQRPSPFELRAELSRVMVPVLVVHGDEDHGALATGVFLKSTIPSAGLAVIPKTGHTVNLEEPALFNQLLQEFFSTVEHGRYSLNDRKDAEAVLLKEGDKAG
jgi:pimeloyl-ACP methyl ester carboxylesterase